MNPFMVFLILIPLLVAFGFWVIAIFLLIKLGFTVSTIAMNLIFGSIVVVLIYLFIRTSRDPLFSDKHLNDFGIADRRTLTNSMIIMTYFTLLLFFTLIPGVGGYVGTVRGLLGTISLIMALAMTCSAVWELRKPGSRERRGPDRRVFADSDQRESFRRRVINARRLLNFFAVVTLCLTSFLFWRFQSVQFISKFDFVSLIILFISIILWLNAKEHTLIK